MIILLTGSDVVGHDGLSGVKICPVRNLGIFLFGLFVLSPCDECVFAGQNVFLGPTTHLTRPECCFESHHLHLIHVVHCCFQMCFQKRH